MQTMFAVCMSGEKIGTGFGITAVNLAWTQSPVEGAVTNSTWGIMFVIYGCHVANSTMICQSHAATNPIHPPTFNR